MKTHDSAIKSMSQLHNTINCNNEEKIGKTSSGRNIKNIPSPKLGLLDKLKIFFSNLFYCSKSPSNEKVSTLDLTPVYNKINQLEKKQSQLEQKIEVLEKTSATLEKNSQENDDSIQCLNRQVLRPTVESDKAKEEAAKQRTYRYLGVGAGCLLGSVTGVAIGGSLGIGMGAILGASAILAGPKILETVCQKANDYIHGIAGPLNFDYERYSTEALLPKVSRGIGTLSLLIFQLFCSIWPVTGVVMRVRCQVNQAC